MTIKTKTYRSGIEEGYQQGLVDAYDKGFSKGIMEAGTAFEGTSIVIPSYNQKAWLKRCIRSIRQFTTEPYEIIVIDNGSTDGTAQYLKETDTSLRYRLLSSNTGFAAGVNQGLKMSRGETVLLMNNDILVTVNWLSNLLKALQSYTNHGLVGPVTNYISGSQKIDVHYRNEKELHQFAIQNNQSDRRRWRLTDRLVGFCMLMRRDTLTRIGFMDEGFELGNCEDDDYGLRARLLGYRLLICEDAFIHHEGSVSMRALKEQFQQVYERNLAYYRKKWGDVEELLAELQTQEQASRQMTDFYPSHITVKGATEPCWWIEDGERHPLLAPYEESDNAAVRLSQLDIRQWPKGAPITIDEWRHKQQLRMQSGEAETLQEGRLYRSAAGRLYQYSDAKLHRFITEQACADWRLQQLPALTLSSQQLDLLQVGLPVISPVQIRANNI